MSSKPWSESTQFNFEQVDQDLGLSEPGDKDDARAFDAFKRILEWVMRNGEGRQKPTQALIYRRVSVVAWLMQPSRTAGTTLRSLADECGVTEGVMWNDVQSFRKVFGIAGPVKRKQGEHDGCQAFAE
jgi:hypothetical protein